MMDPLAQPSRPSYQPKTTSRVGDSCRVVMLGVVLFAVGVCVLVYQESSAVSVRRSFSVSALSIDSFDSKNDRKLVHITGEVRAGPSEDSNPDEVLVDDVLGFRVDAESGVLKLRRYAEMFQWVESEELTNGDYTYTKEWDSMFNDSEDFDEEEEHKNPTYMAYRSKVFEVESMHVGDFELSESIIQKMNWYEPIHQTIHPEDIANEKIQSKTRIEDNIVYISLDKNDHDPSKNPQIGDSRITYESFSSQTISIIAQQLDHNLVPYQKISGGNIILLIRQGDVSAPQMMKDASTAATAHLVWYRLGTFILIYCSLVILAKPASILEDVFPLVASVTGANFELGVAMKMMLPLTAMVVTTIVAICWLFYYPVISLLVLGAEGYLIYEIGRRSHLWGVHPDNVAFLEEFMELRNVMQ